MSMTAAERTLRAQLGAHALHSQGKTNTKAARDARWESFLDQVDPDRKLSEEERTRRAKHAEQAHMARLSLKAAKARRRARNGVADDAR